MAHAITKEKLIAELDDIISWGTVAAPFIVMLVVSPFNLNSFGLPKVTALYLITLFLAYFQVRKWLETGKIEFTGNPAHLLVGIVVLIAIINTIFSASPLASLLGRFSRQESLLALLCYAIILWFASQQARTATFRERFRLLFVLSFAIASGYGILAILGFDFLGLNSLSEGRVSSLFGNPVFYGTYLSMALPVLFAQALMHRGGASRPWEHPAVTFALLALGLIMLFATLSRGAWLGATVAFLTVAYLAIKTGQKPMPGSWRLAIILLIGIALVTSLALDLTDQDSNYVSKEVTSSASLENRIEIWKSSLYTIKDRPLLGYGLDQTKDWLNAYLTPKLARLENTLHGRAHNIYLQMLLDGGILFLLAQLWLFIYVIVKGIRVIRQSKNAMTIGFLGAITGYLTQGITGIAMNELSVFFWFILGATVSFDQAITKIRIINLPIAGRLRALNLAAVITFSILAFLAITPLLLEASFSSSLTQAAEHNNESALKQAHEISKYMIHDPYYQREIAEQYLRFAKQKKDVSYARVAVNILERALRYSPHSPELLYKMGLANLTVAQFSGGKKDLDIAGAYYDRALKKAPFLLSIHEEMLQLHLQKHDYPGAIRRAKFIRSIKD